MKDNSTGKGRRQYSDEERDAILADAEALGVAESARKHGVPQSTLSNWRNRPMAKRRRTAAEVAPAPIPPASWSTKRVAKRYTPSQKAEIVEYAAKHSVLKASTHFGVSRFAIYDWQKRVAKAARGEGPSPTSGPSQSEIEEQRDREILGEWHKHRGLGPSQIKNQLARRSIKVSVATVHLDFVHRYIHRANTFTLILIDDHSRFVVGHGVDDRERSAMVIRTFEEAVARHGKPERVMSDGGSAFWSWRGISKFTTLLTEMEIEHEKATLKEHNGKVEVFNGNLHKELFDVHRFWDVTEMMRRLSTHLHWYNHARTHHALGGLLVPADRYYGRAEEVLARIESGALRDGDELSLGERCLDLFKVVSRGGVPEVWLLGQRLLAPTTP